MGIQRCPAMPLLYWVTRSCKAISAHSKLSSSWARTRLVQSSTLSQRTERGLPPSVDERSGVTRQSNVDDGSGKSVVHGRDEDHALRDTPSAQPAVPGFSCSVGNTIAVSNVAWQLYKRCKGGPEGLCDMSQELQSLHAVLRECEGTFSATSMPPQREERLRVIMCGWSEVLEQLQKHCQQI